MKTKTPLLLLLSLVLVMVVSTLANSSNQTREDERARHPRIASAISALEEAKAEMQAASHDYGGHKEASIKACDQAIRELRLALAYKAEEDRHRGRR